MNLEYTNPVQHANVFVPLFVFWLISQHWWQLMNTYLFFRQDGFYMVPMRDDQDAKWNAEINPGTYRVETMDGRVIWADNNRMN